MRDYTDYYYVDSENLQKVKINENPIKHKLFNQDILTYEDNKLEVVHSTVKIVKIFRGVGFAIG